MTERVAIVGARRAMPSQIDEVDAYVESLPSGSIVVSGGADGIDKAATSAALRRGLGTLEFVVVRTFTNQQQTKWFLSIYVILDGNREEQAPHVSFFRTQSYRDALIFRNTLIAMECDRARADVRGSQGGTFDFIRQAERFKRPCEVVR